MKRTQRAHVFKPIGGFFPLSIAAAVIAAGVAFSTGCLPKLNPIVYGSHTITPAQKTITFVNARLSACDNDLLQLDFEADIPGGRHNADSARAEWRRARNEYERARFAVEEFAPSVHRQIAAWFTPAPPASGFHLLESYFFGKDSANVNWGEVYQYIIGSINYVQNGSAKIGLASVSDSGIFAGLEYMLADIDSIKFSGLDSGYSRNSYNDIFSNYDGLDSVYSYYRTIVKDSSAATDTLFTSRLLAARVALQNAGSLAALNKNAYRANYLFPLDTAVKNVAAAIGVRLQ